MALLVIIGCSTTPQSKFLAKKNLSKENLRAEYNKKKIQQMRRAFKYIDNVINQRSIIIDMKQTGELEIITNTKTIEKKALNSIKL